MHLHMQHNEMGLSLWRYLISNLFWSISNAFVQNATDLSQWKLESTKAREAHYNVEFEMERGLVSDQFQWYWRRRRLNKNLTFLQKQADSPSNCAAEDSCSSEGRLLVFPCQEELCRQVGEGGGGGAGQAPRGGLGLAHRCIRPSGWSRSSSAASSPSSPVSPSSSAPCTTEPPCC